MANFSKTDTRRITFLSLLGSASEFTKGDDAYGQALDWLDQMERDGFFEEEVGSGNGSSSGRNAGSGRQGSRSRSGNSGSRGRDRARSGGGNGGFTIKDPDAPATKSQIGKLLSLTEDYTWEEAEDFTKGEISNLIDDLA